MLQYFPQQHNKICVAQGVVRGARVERQFQIMSMVISLIVLGTLLNILLVVKVKNFGDINRSYEMELVLKPISRKG
jgi:hypothetical protein